MSDGTVWAGRPVRVWATEILCQPGMCPKVGDVVKVRASNGTAWAAPITVVHSHNPKSGRTVVITPTKAANPLAAEDPGESL
jgi:hypothetical protein